MRGKKLSSILYHQIVFHFKFLCSNIQIILIIIIKDYRVLTYLKKQSRPKKVGGFANTRSNYYKIYREISLTTGTRYQYQVCKGLDVEL